LDLDLLPLDPTSGPTALDMTSHFVPTPKYTPRTESLKWPSDDGSISTFGNEMTPRFSTSIVRFHRTMIVDDSQVNRKLMRKLLTNYFDIIDEVE
jgi:hypothetical protein